MGMRCLFNDLLYFSGLTKCFLESNVKDMVKIIMCDKCNEVIRKDHFSIFYDRKGSVGHNKAELCEECSKPLEEYLHHFFNN